MCQLRLRLRRPASVITTFDPERHVFETDVVEIVDPIFQIFLNYRAQLEWIRT